MIVIGTEVLHKLNRPMKKAAVMNTLKKKIINIPWFFLIKRIISSIPYMLICYVLGNYVKLSDIYVLFWALVLSGCYFIIETIFVLRLPILASLMPKKQK